MIRPARIAGFAAIALAAFGTAASIAAIGDSGRIGAVRYSAIEPLPERVAPAVRTASTDGVCAVTLMVGDAVSAPAAVVAPVEVSVRANETMDLDMPGSSGFSVACGGGTAPAADAEMSDTDVHKGDLAAL